MEFNNFELTCDFQVDMQEPRKANPPGACDLRGGAGDSWVTAHTSTVLHGIDSEGPNVASCVVKDPDDRRRSKRSSHSVREDSNNLWFPAYDSWLSQKDVDRKSNLL